MTCLERYFPGWLMLWALLQGCTAGVHAADPDVCAVCGEPIIDAYYSMEDQVTLDKRHVCKRCEQSYPECFICGLPANTNLSNFVELPDKRSLCARDAKTAIIGEEEGLRVCRDVRDSLDRLFSRFTSFPETNVTIRVVDRVHLHELFKVAGNDYHCPNVWGITQTRTNHSRIEHEISLLSGLPASWFQATCAHECGHTWIAEHLPPRRKEVLNRNAEEGFCELLAFLFVDSVNDEAQKRLILRNAYTRGQIDLFVAAQRSYGFNEILDWMQFGVDDRLSEAEPGRIRKIDPAPRIAPAVSLGVPAPPKPRFSEVLALKAIFWNPKHPTAVINDHAFNLNEEAHVHLGTSNVLVRCLSITADSVRLRVVGADRDQTLRLR